VEEGQLVSKPTAPTKTGHTFAGWYKEAGCTTLWNFEKDVVVKATTLYAKWVVGTLSSFTVTFDPNGGAPVPAAQEVVQGEKVPEPVAPTKTGFIFNGWYSGETAWNFSTATVSGNITLKAQWVQAVTVTFNTNGGSAIAPVSLKPGDSLNPGNYRPDKANYIFDGWYTDQACTTPVALDYGRLTVTEDITLYAKWTSTDKLAPYTGVWGSSSDARAYILEGDGTCLVISSYFYSWYRGYWSLTEIDGDEVSFNDSTFTVTSYGSTYTKNTTEKKTPAQNSNLTGSWVTQNTKIEFKDAKAVGTRYGDTLTLGYVVEENALYLLQETTNLVILSIPMTDGIPQGFSRVESDQDLAGIWKLTDAGQDYYWELDAGGTGTFHTLGASIPVSFTITQGTIDGNSYTVSGDTLKVTGWDEDEDEEQSSEISYAKVASVSGSGAAGDSRLQGSWKSIQPSGDGNTIILTFNGNGTVKQSISVYEYDFIWKADGSNLGLYYPYIGNTTLGETFSYSISGSTLNFNGSPAFTKQ
jgi:uncharacterized repeat protein (TIGR02543 family)